MVNITIACDHVEYIYFNIKFGIVSYCIIVHSIFIFIFSHNLFYIITLSLPLLYHHMNMTFYFISLINVWMIFVRVIIISDILLLLSSYIWLLLSKRIVILFIVFWCCLRFDLLIDIHHFLKLARLTSMLHQITMDSGIVIRHESCHYAYDRFHR